MTHAAGTRLGGIRTLDDLRDRCHIDDDTGCWIWRGATTRARPSLWLPAIGTRTSSGNAICILVTGERPKKGAIWHVTCGETLCCNPAHRNRRGNRSTQMLAAKITRSPATRAKIAKTKVVDSPFDAAVIAAIRMSAGTLEEVAEQFGCSPSYASRVRRGELRAQTVAVNSSVFAYRGAA